MGLGFGGIESSLSSTMHSPQRPLITLAEQGCDERRVSVVVLCNEDGISENVLHDDQRVEHVAFSFYLFFPDDEVVRS